VTASEESSRRSTGGGSNFSNSVSLENQMEDLIYFAPAPAGPLRRFFYTGQLDLT
jgi:hypothetical protein